MQATLRPNAFHAIVSHEGTDIGVEACNRVEQSGWLELRRDLQPQLSTAQHLAEMASVASNPSCFRSFIAYRRGAAVGLLEASVGPESHPGRSGLVAWMDGLATAPAIRGADAVAKALVATFRAWARGRGCTSIGIDAFDDEKQVIRACVDLGYEVQRKLVLLRASID